jgi:hypothetical protein
MLQQNHYVLTCLYIFHLLPLGGRGHKIQTEIHFPNAFLVILYTLLAMMFTYCRYKPIIQFVILLL